MTSDLQALQEFAEEMTIASPGTAVAAVFSPDVFGPDVSESAVIIGAVRAGVKDFLRRPLSSADLEQLIDRLARRSLLAPRRLGKTVFFLGNKGGVGKSTVAVNVGCGLARQYPEKVLLIDASLQMGVCASMLDLRPATTMTDAYLERERLDETLLRQLATPHDSGLHLLAAPADAVEAAYIDDEIMSRIVTLARRSYDYVIIDSFPMIDRVIMAVLDLSDQAYVVLESVVPTLRGGAKLLQLLEDLDVPPQRIRIILNRYLNFAGNLKPHDVAELLGRPVDHLIPYRKEVVVSANLGRPHILRSSRFFGFGRAITRIIAEVSATATASAPAPANGRPPSNFRSNGARIEPEAEENNEAIS
jgi:pilus assembly protein CpaE